MLQYALNKLPDGLLRVAVQQLVDRLSPYECYAWHLLGDIWLLLSLICLGYLCARLSPNDRRAPNSEHPVPPLIS